MVSAEWEIRQRRLSQSNRAFLQRLHQRPRRHQVRVSSFGGDSCPWDTHSESSSESWLRCAEIWVVFKTSVWSVNLTVEVGSCYVVVAMRNMFSEGELPGETPTTSAGSDVCSFTQLHQYAQNVYEKCSRPEINHPGWYPAGRHPVQPNRLSWHLWPDSTNLFFFKGDLNSIAVFLWQAASDINKRIHLPHHTGLDTPYHTGLNLISTSGSTTVAGSLHDTA